MTTPTEEQRQAACDLYAALPPDHAPDGHHIGLIAQLLATREAAWRERAETAERDYRIVEAAIRSFGFPVVEAEPAAKAIRKLGEERDTARAQVKGWQTQCEVEVKCGETMAETLKHAQERAERAERDYRIVEAAIRSVGFPVVEAETAAKAIYKLSDERNEARAKEKAWRTQCDVEFKRAEAAMRFAKEMAEFDCTYGDNCPGLHGNPQHGPCVGCRARAVHSTGNT